MTPAQKTTLQALLIALAQLETTLLEDLRQDIRQIGDDLEEQPTVALDKIPQLVTKHPQLNDLYKTARSNLQNEYQVS